MSFWTNWHPRQVVRHGTAGEPRLMPGEGLPAGGARIHSPRGADEAGFFWRWDEFDGGISLARGASVHQGFEPDHGLAPTGVQPGW